MKRGSVLTHQAIDFLTSHVKRQPPNPFAPLVPLMKDPNISILAQGVPPMEIFPLKDISVTLQDGTLVSLSNNDVQSAQRYSPFAWGPLLGWCKRHMESIHGLPNTLSTLGKSQENSWDVAISAGSMSSVQMAFSMFLEPGNNTVQGDWLLVEEFSFTASLDCLQAMGCHCVCVPMDEHGIIPSKLLEVLENCKKAVEEYENNGTHHLNKRKKIEGNNIPNSIDGNIEERTANDLLVPKMPKVLYTIPVGQNPTGGRLPDDRYREIYDICREFNIVIIEDDPYFYLQHQANDPLIDPENNQQHFSSGQSEKDGETSSEATLSLGMSFLSIDTDGRVLRLDSFSKVLAPGFRLGWVTGPSSFIKAYNAMAYCGSQNGSSLSMTILGRMLEHFEQTNKFEKNILQTQALLRTRCRSLVSLTSEHLSDLVEFHCPPAGLFLWLKLKPNLKSFPSDDDLHVAMKKHHIVFLPGSVCTVMSSADHASMEETQDIVASFETNSEIRRYLRLSFVSLESTYDVAIQNLRRLILDLCGPQSPAD